MLGVKVQFLGRSWRQKPGGRLSDSHPPRDPVVHARFLERQAFRDLKVWADNCGYCGVSSNKRPGTFDHIRPDSAGGDETLSNGVAVCSPCNSDRGNVPFMNFLEGERGQYEYRNEGREVVMVDARPSPSTRACGYIQDNFARYFQELLRNTRKLPKGWLSKTMDNLIYPVWGYGREPGNPVIRSQMAQNQLVRLIRILAPQDRTFWLGQEFQGIARKNLDEYRFKSLCKAIGEVQRSVGTVVRFGAGRLQAMIG